MKFELKNDPLQFQAVWDGTKLYEFRRGDRKRGDGSTGFAVDDELLLRETVQSAVEMIECDMLHKPTYTGREVECVVTHKLAGEYGIPEGMCLLGIKRVRLINKKSPHNGASWTPQQPDKPTLVEQAFAGLPEAPKPPTFGEYCEMARTDDRTGWFLRPRPLSAEIPDEAKGQFVIVGYYGDGEESGWSTNFDWTLIHAFKPLGSAVRQDGDMHMHTAGVGKGVTGPVPDSPAEKLFNKRAPVPPFVIAAKREFSHYFRPCPYDGIDVYRTLEIFGVTSPAIQHAIKKLLVPGRRGAKDVRKDLSEAVVSINRAIEMLDEDDRNSD